MNALDESIALLMEVMSFYPTLNRGVGYGPGSKADLPLC